MQDEPAMNEALQEMKKHHESFMDVVVPMLMKDAKWRAFVYKPSCLLSTLDQLEELQCNLLTMMHGPFVNGDGKIVAYSMDDEGNKMDQDQLKKHYSAIHEQFALRRATLKSQVTEYNQAVVALAKKYSLSSAGQLYEEWNKRAQVSSSASASASEEEEEAEEAAQSQ